MSLVLYEEAFKAEVDCTSPEFEAYYVEYWENYYTNAQPLCEEFTIQLDTGMAQENSLTSLLKKQE
jgi:hypothetical protein